MEEAREFHNLVVSEIYKTVMRNAPVRNRDILSELQVYGITRPRVYRIITALADLKFLIPGDVQGENLGTPKVQLGEKIMADRSWEWLKEFDRKKTRARVKGELNNLIAIKQKMTQTTRPEITKTTSRQKANSTGSLTELLDAMKKVEELKRVVEGDAVLKETMYLQTTVSQLREQLAQCQTQLRELQADYETVLKERDELRQENRTLYEKLNHKN